MKNKISIKPFQLILYMILFLLSKKPKIMIYNIKYSIYLFKDINISKNINRY